MAKLVGLPLGFADNGLFGSIAGKVSSDN